MIYYDCNYEMDDSERNKRESREEKYFFLIDDYIKMIMSKFILLDGKMIEVFQLIFILIDMFNYGFIIRYGGVFIYKILLFFNLVYFDKRRDLFVNVQENRRRLVFICRFDFDKLRVVKCVYEVNVWVVGDLELDSYDGLVIDNSYAIIVVFGVDCLIVLFCDLVKKV